MVDYFALALSHSLLFIAVWHLLSRGDLDEEPAPAEPNRTPDSPSAPPKPGLRTRA